jgi:di-N-acetylchitobiase
VSSSPWFNYVDGSGNVHQVWYDDIESLNYKYDLVSQLNLGGAGMWEANALEYRQNHPEGRWLTKRMWEAISMANLP